MQCCGASSCVCGLCGRTVHEYTRTHARTQNGEMGHTNLAFDLVTCLVTNGGVFVSVHSHFPCRPSTVAWQVCKHGA